MVAKKNIISSALVLLVMLAADQWIVEAKSEGKCEKSDTECYFKLVVDYGLTMMHGKEKMLVKAKNGQLYSYDTTDYTNAQPYDADEIITGDAYPEPRLMMTYNGTVPGPALHIYEGQTIHLTVTNNMLHESTTVHLHGQYQQGTPYSDGVPFVSQCPILPGQTFTQVFTAKPSGTFFYHAHSGPQLTNGLYGALIVYPRDPSPINLSQLDSTIKGPSPSIEEEEHIIFFQDFNHDWDANMMTMKMRYGQYKDGKKIPNTKTIADINYSLFAYHSGLINGRGRFHYDNDTTEGPLSTFSVKPNTYYRFRLINSGDIYPFRVTIDSHHLLVVATDGYDINPHLVDSVIVNVGERFDVIIRTDKTPGNFWIIGETLEAGMNHIAEAILNYEGTPKEQDPKEIQDSTVTRTVLNCPFENYPQGAGYECYNLDQIKSLKPDSDLIEAGSNFKEYFMNFAFPGKDETPGSVNGRAFLSPPISSVTQPNDDTLTCSRDDCGPDKICHCPYTVTIQGGDVVQLVFTNIGGGKGWDHPIHLHGHGFQVVKMVYPTYNTTTGKFIYETEDIKCEGSFCNKATWKNSTWKNGNVPGLRLKHVPTKDNIIVPSGGYVIVRFRADNPGLWIVHCHIGLHLTDGMAALVSEDKPNWPQRPQGFPTCHNYVPGLTKSPSAATTATANVPGLTTNPSAATTATANYVKLVAAAIVASVIVLGMVEN